MMVALKIDNGLGNKILKSSIKVNFQNANFCVKKKLIFFMQWHIRTHMHIYIFLIGKENCI